MVVPFDAGGPTDTVTRLIAEPMKATLGQEVVVQNVAGAGGTLAAGQVAQAAPDGYTVLMHHIGMSTAPSLYADLPYDPLVDFKTIGLVTEVPMTIIGRKSFEPNTLQELVDYVKANKDSVGYAHAGPGAASQAVRAALHGRHRHQGHRGPLFRHRPGHGRHPRRSGRCGLHVRPDDEHDRADKDRPRQGLCDHEPGAQRRPARCADDDGRRIAGRPGQRWHGLYGRRTPRTGSSRHSATPSRLLSRIRT